MIIKCARQAFAAQLTDVTYEDLREAALGAEDRGVVYHVNYNAAAHQLKPASLGDRAAQCFPCFGGRGNRVEPVRQPQPEPSGYDMKSASASGSPASDD